MGMGFIRIVGIVIGGFGVAIGLVVIWHFAFINDGWTANEMDPWLLTSMLSFIVGVVVFFVPLAMRGSKKGPWS